MTEQEVPVSILSWSSKKIIRLERNNVAAETTSMATCMEQLDWMRTLLSRMTTAEFSLDNYEGALKKQPASVLGGRLQESVRHVSHGKSGPSINGLATCD